MGISYGEIVQPFRRFEQKIASLNASTSVDVPLGVPGRLTNTGRMSLVSGTFTSGTTDAKDDSHNLSIIIYKVPVVAGVAGTKVEVARLHWASTAKTCWTSSTSSAGIRAAPASASRPSTASTTTTRATGC